MEDILLETLNKGRKDLIFISVFYMLLAECFGNSDSGQSAPGVYFSRCTVDNQHCSNLGSIKNSTLQFYLGGMAACI